MTKTNPRRRPATGADVARAWGDGVAAGVSNACAIILTVLLDKFDFGEQIPEAWAEINKLSEEVKERRVSLADLRCVLREEYGIEV